MKHHCRAAVLACAALLFSATGSPAEKVADLPSPTSYVSDFAGVLSDRTRLSVEDLCTQVDREAHAQIAVVTIRTLDNDQSIEEFSTQLEDKWKVGAKGTDRGVLMVFVMTPVKGRIEVGYGLEGILNDAKVGDIGRAMAPFAQQGDYNRAIPLGVQRIADVIAADAGVTLTPLVHSAPLRRQATQISFGQLLIVGVIALIVLVLLAGTGNLGILWFILGSLMGGGGNGGGRDRDDNDSGGFGGFGGGGSGGGGASGDF